LLLLYCSICDADLVLEEEEELSFTDISKLRPREIKRRLVRKHGYTPEEVARMIDKKVLIETLVYEEHLQIQKISSAKQRKRIQTSIVVALIAIVVAACWPMIRMATKQLYEIICVNFIIYTDKKRYEFRRCKEYDCTVGYIGLTVVTVLDILILWLNASTTLSWITPNKSFLRKYFFPTPNLPIYAHGFGINIGGFFVLWLLSWIKSSVVERFIAKRLIAAQRFQKDIQKKKRREARRVAAASVTTETKTESVIQEDSSDIPTCADTDNLEQLPQSYHNSFMDLD